MALFQIAKELTSILGWAQESGKKTGFVTTARFKPTELFILLLRCK